MGIGIGFLIYEVVGFLLIAAVACTSVGRIIMHYGTDVMDRLSDWMDIQLKSVYDGDKTCRVMSYVIGMLVWPLRLAEAPMTLQRIWDRAEVISKELSNEKNES